MASRSSRKPSRGKYRDDDDYDDDLTPDERRRRERERQLREMNTAEMFKYVFLALLPIGVPILATFFRPLAGSGPNLSLLWTVLMSLALMFGAIISILVIPKRGYYRISFLLVGSVLGYVVLLTVMGVRTAMVVGWDEAKSDKEEFSVAVPTSVNWKTGPGGEHFSLDFGGYTYTAGFRDLSGADLDRVSRSILEDKQPISDPFETQKIPGEDGRAGSEVSRPIEVDEKLFNDPEVILETYEISAHHFQGRRFIVRGLFVVDVYLVNSRMYFLSISGEGVNPNSVVARKFLSSFRLIDPPAKQEQRQNFNYVPANDDGAGMEEDDGP